MNCSRCSDKLTNYMNHMCNIWLSDSETNQAADDSVHKLGSDIGIPSEGVYRALVSRGVSTILLLVRCARKNISVIYFDWERR